VAELAKKTYRVSLQTVQQPKLMSLVSLTREQSHKGQVPHETIILNVKGWNGLFVPPYRVIIPSSPLLWVILTRSLKDEPYC